MSQSVILQAFLRELQAQPHHPQYYSSESVIQSSVGIIFRLPSSKFSSIEHIIGLNSVKAEVLLTQRAGYERDPNAYNIVFPGGQADDGESDLVACKRELREEISLDVDEDCLFAGSFPRNFYYSKKRGKSIYITCHVWILKQGSDFEPTLNPSELIDFRWVPLEEILNPNSLQNYTELKLNIFNRMGWQKTIADRVRPYFIHASLPALDVRMQRPLWGVTLWIVSYFLQMAAHNLGGRDLSELNSTISFLKTMNVQFKPGFPLATPLRWVVSGWHNAYRVKPFSYPKRSNNQYWIMVAILCLILYVGAQLFA